ncbi:MAG: hypothetical protein ACRDXX_03290, partial [Stackebrandtia sp.]
MSHASVPDDLPLWPNSAPKDSPAPKPPDAGVAAGSRPVGSAKVPASGGEVEPAPPPPPSGQPLYPPPAPPTYPA